MRYNIVIITLYHWIKWIFSLIDCSVSLPYDRRTLDLSGSQLQYIKQCGGLTGYETYPSIVKYYLVADQWEFAWIIWIIWMIWIVSGGSFALMNTIILQHSLPVSSPWSKSTATGKVWSENHANHGRNTGRECCSIIIFIKAKEQPDIFQIMAEPSLQSYDRLTLQSMREILRKY